MTPIVVDKRYCGAANSGNGGYVCGRLARHIPGGAEVTLRAPPPLQRPLNVVATDDGSWELRDGATVVATGRTASIELAQLEGASLAEAHAAELPTRVKPHEHPLPTCFVCGPSRAPGHGLRIFAGPLARQSRNASAVLAATWTPEPTLVAEDGFVAPEFLWAALDCPSDMFRISIGRAPDSTGRRCCWVGCRHGSRRRRARENAASSLPGRPAATAANAWPRPQPMGKLERCWPWHARGGLQSTAKCSSAAPEASYREISRTSWTGTGRCKIEDH
jgi:hypothetical protein